MMSIDTSPVPNLPSPVSPAEGEARQLALQFVEQRIEQIAHYSSAALAMIDAGDTAGMVYCARCLTANARHMATAIKGMYSAAGASAGGAD